MKYTIQHRVLSGVCKIRVCTLWPECVEAHFQGNLQITPDGLIMTTERENRSNGLELIIGYLASLCSFSSLHRRTFSSSSSSSLRSHITPDRFSLTKNSIHNSAQKYTYTARCCACKHFALSCSFSLFALFSHCCVAFHQYNLNDIEQ